MIYLQRKKLAFMSIVNQIKGFVRTVSGALPLTLPDCISGGLLNYTLDGNSVQNGTPTPEAPVEVESVGEYDEETGKYKIPIKCSDGKGNSVTTNIYLDEPLRKIREYGDYIDFENQKVVRQIAKEAITNVYNKSSVSGTYSVYLSVISKKPLRINDIGYALSDKFVMSKLVYGVGFANIPNQIQSYITSGKLNRVAYTFGSSAINTVELAQEAIGDGFDAYYILAESEEIPISLPKLPTFSGTTIYTIDTSIQPSNMSATYYATSKE